PVPGGVDPAGSADPDPDYRVRGGQLADHVDDHAADADRVGGRGVPAGLREHPALLVHHPASDLGAADIDPDRQRPAGRRHPTAHWAAPPACSAPFCFVAICCAGPSCFAAVSASAPSCFATAGSAAGAVAAAAVAAAHGSSSNPGRRLPDGRVAAPGGEPSGEAGQTVPTAPATPRASRTAPSASAPTPVASFSV